MSSIQDQYESLPYPHYVHPLTDPSHLATVGRILGLHPADPAVARVLDIGCGAGTNLLAMAERLPGSRFVGLDFSSPDIASAQAIASQAKLENIEFRQTDLMVWEPGDEKFDYIIAYGFFSWVPDAVKDRLLKLIRQCLAPQGIACVSYMTYPGCKQPESIRDLLRLRTESLASPADKVSMAQATLGFLDRAWQALPRLPHSGYLREEVNRIRQKEPHFLLLDDLGVERDPCYLLQFVNWAAEHGLRYLGESEFNTMLLENLPPESVREMLALKLDRLESEQMLDYVMNRSFRCTLLVGPEADVAEGLHTDAFGDSCFAPRLYWVGKQKHGGAEATFVNEQRTRVTLKSVPLVAFARALGERKGALTPCAELVAAAEQLAGRAFTAGEQARLYEDLLTLFGRNELKIAAVPFSLPLDIPDRPQMTPLNFALARERSIVVTAMHEAVRINTDQQKMCALLDGSRTVAELKLAIARDAPGLNIGDSLKSLAAFGCLC